MAAAHPVHGTGAITGRASIPSEAGSKGGLNETTSAPERAINRSDIPETDGPRILDRGNGNTSHLPATYEVVGQSLPSTDSPARTIKMTRTDR